MFTHLLNEKSNSYDLIIVILDCLIKVVYYKFFRVIIDAIGFIEVIIHKVVIYHGLPESRINKQSLLFTPKSGTLLCYFLDIK